MTTMQRYALEFINMFTRYHGYPPNARELSVANNWASNTSGDRLIKKLLTEAANGTN